MGKLKVNDSFGEISIITEEPISCSIVTATAVELAIIEPEKLKGLCQFYFIIPHQNIFTLLKILFCFYIHKTFPSSNYKIDQQQFQMIEIQND